MRTAKCRGCGAEIVWIPTLGGKSMPCDAEPVYYKMQAKGPEKIGDPIIQVVRDANGNPSVEARNLASGRSDVTFGIIATENLNDWSNAKLVPMEKFTSDGLWKPAASGSSGYVFPAQMFYKYTIDIK